VLVDTSALFALLDRSDRDHERTGRSFRQLRDARDALIIHNYVVVEAVALIQRRLGAPAAVSLLRELVPTSQMIWIDQGVHSAAAEQFSRVTSRAVSLVDLVSFELMRREGIDTAFALDPDFVSAGFRTVP